ncbi:MAG: T9SS type A sorting domain-containing protein [Bacteroidales bacterium]
MKILFCSIFTIFMVFTSYSQQGFVIDHTSCDISIIPDNWIDSAKKNLKIRYFRRSHGSQVDKGGMAALRRFSVEYNQKYAYNATGANGELFLSAPPSTEWVSLDFENATWVQITRDYLDNPANSEINVIMWAWSSNFYACDPQQYVDDMEMLISEYGHGGSKNRPVPVTFVFQTACGQQNQPRNSLVFAGNQLIRQHCLQNNRILFDFNDIECYDPDGHYYGDADLNGNYTNIRRLADDLSYNSDSTNVSWDGERGNWGIEWRSRNPQHELTALSANNICTECAHSDGIESNQEDNSRLHCVLKGMAVWNLWAKIAGWQDKYATISTNSPLTEGNLNGSLIELTLNGKTFKDAALSTSGFRLNGAPSGTTIGSVTYISQNSAQLTIQYTGLDFDSNYQQFSVTTLATELSDNKDITSNSIPISAFIETLTISTSVDLNEHNLINSSLDIQLSGDYFIDNTISIANIQLNNSPSGLTVNNVTYVNNQQLTIGLSYTNADFDVSYPNFSVTISGNELSGGDNLVSNELNIEAFTENLTVSVSPNLTERNLNASTLTLELSGDNFTDNTISPASITFNNAPQGLTVEAIHYINNQQITVDLAYTNADIDVSYPNFSVTISGNELSGGDNLAGNALNIEAFIENLTLSASANLTERNLNTSTLTLELSGDNFIDNTISPANITLNNAPLGLSVEAIHYINNQQITVDLAYTNADLDVSYPDFSVIISGNELSGGDNLASNALNIEAFIENLTLSASANLTERNLNTSTLTLQLADENFIDNAINPENITFNNAPQGLSIETIHYINNQQITIDLAYSNADFDISYPQFSVTINEIELSGSNNSISNIIAIEGYNEVFSISTATALNENNLNQHVLTLQLQNEFFIENQLNTSYFELINAPEGLSVASINPVSNQQIQLYLGFNGTDFDINYSNFTITINEAALEGFHNLTGNSLVITCIHEGSYPEAHLISNSNLVESTLNGSKVNVSLKDEKFNRPGLSLTNFVPENAPEGLSFSQITYQNDTLVELGILFSGQDFDADSIHFCVHIKAGALKLNSALKTDSLTIYSENENGFTEPDKSNNLHVFPNPARDFINILVKEPTSDKIRISIVNEFGQFVFKNVDYYLRNEKTEISLANLSNGKYILIVENGKGKYQKLIIRE